MQKQIPNSPTRQQHPPKDVAALIVAQRRQIEAALPKHFNGERFARIALTELRKNPELAKCDPLSFLGAVIQCAQLGLEPGSGLGHAYLIPFKNSRRNIVECQFLPGYKGLIDLARRSGQVETISARIVRERDGFSYQYGDDERIEHRPWGGPEEDAGRITHVYAIARLKGGGIQREVMTRAQVDRIKERNGHRNAVWDSDFDEMARKTVVRRICKYLPLSPELARAIDADNSHDSDEGQENWRILDADYEPVPTAHDPGKINDIWNEAAADKTPPPAQNPAVTAANNALRDVWSKVLRVGGKPIEILGLKATFDAGATPTEALWSYADRLNGWLEKTGA